MNLTIANLLEAMSSRFPEAWAKCCACSAKPNRVYHGAYLGNRVKTPHFWAVLKTHTDIVMVLGLDHQNGLLLFVGTWLAWFLWFHAQNAQNVRLIEFRINQCVSL